MGIKEGIGVTDFGIAVIDTDGTVTKNDTLKNVVIVNPFQKELLSISGLKACHCKEKSKKETILIILLVSL